jgi:adenylate kinase
MHKPIILIYGPVGSGKGTQAELLVQKLGVVHLSLGDILRAKVAQNTPDAQVIKDYMSKGELVPFHIVDDIVRQRMEEPDVANGVVFDGYPRALEQAMTLVKILQDQGKKVTHVIAIKLGTDEIIERLSNRRICPNCREIYNVVSEPPKVEGICDKCGTALIKRADDQEVNAIHERMQVYQEETLPVRDYFAKQGLVHEFDGNQGINELHEQIYKIFE